MNYKRDMITVAALQLDKFEMVRFDDKNGYFHATDLGRVASHYYIKAETVEVIICVLKFSIVDVDLKIQ